MFEKENKNNEAIPKTVGDHSRDKTFSVSFFLFHLLAN
jgi:hypothetical protein